MRVDGDGRWGFPEGLRASVPVVVGYLPAAVAFGIAARGAGLSVAEHVVTQEEAGLHPGQLPALADRLILGVSRDGGRGPRIPFNGCAVLPLKAGDIVVYFSAGADPGIG